VSVNCRAEAGIAQQQHNQDDSNTQARKEFLQHQSPELAVLDEHGRYQWQAYR